MPPIRLWWIKIPMANKVLVVGAALLTAWLVYPPWIGHRGDRTWHGEHHWLWDVSSPTSRTWNEIDLRQLGIGAVVIALLTGIAFLFARANQRPVKSDEQIQQEEAERVQHQTQERERQAGLKKARQMPRWVVVVGILFIPVISGLAMLGDWLRRSF